MLTILNGIILFRYGGDHMKKAVLFVLSMILVMSPLMLVSADEDTPGDDLVETVFEGVVTDLVAEKPIENVLISGFDESYSEWRSDITDEEGRYYLEFRRGGTFYIIADHEDYYQEEKIVDSEINENNIVNFELEPKIYNTTIYGTVTDSETGEPLSDVVVSLGEVYYDDSGHKTKWGEYLITDVDGKYSFEVFKGNFSISARKEEYYGYSSEDFFVDEGEEYQLDIELEPWDQGVFGKVTDEEGNPISDLVVTLENDWIRANDVTDENGEYEIITPWAGEYTLKAHEDGYRPYVENIDIGEGEMEEVDIEMVESQLPSPILTIVYMIMSLLAGL